MFRNTKTSQKSKMRFCSVHANCFLAVLLASITLTEEAPRKELKSLSTLLPVGNINDESTSKKDQAVTPTSSPCPQFSNTDLTVSSVTFSPQPKPGALTNITLEGKALKTVDLSKLVLNIFKGTSIVGQTSQAYKATYTTGQTVTAVFSYTPPMNVPYTQVTGHLQFMGTASAPPNSGSAVGDQETTFGLDPAPKVVACYQFGIDFKGDSLREVTEEAKLE